MTLVRVWLGIPEEDEYAYAREYNDEGQEDDEGYEPRRRAANFRNIIWISW